MKNMFKIIASLFAIMMFLGSCGEKPEQAIEIGGNTTLETSSADVIEITDSQFELSKMKLGQLEDYNFSNSVRTTGQIEVPIKNRVSVSAYAGGYVKSINLIPGGWVNKGQVLFTLENPEFVQLQQDYLESKAQLAYLQSDYERQKTLADENIASKKNYLKAESEYYRTLATMEGLKKRMSLLGISTDKLTAGDLVSSIAVSAPSYGYITGVNAVKGMFLNPTDVAVELVNTNHLHLELKVFEKDILKLKKGQKIRFKIPDASQETYDAEVHLIGKSVDGDNRVIMVHGNIKDNKATSNFVPGMFVEAEIIVEQNTSKGLPEAAVVEVDNKKFILVSKGKFGASNQFEKKEVQIGLRERGIVQILNHDDLVSERPILVSGAFNLINEE